MSSISITYKGFFNKGRAKNIAAKAQNWAYQFGVNNLQEDYSWNPLQMPMFVITISTSTDIGPEKAWLLVKRCANLGERDELILAELSITGQGTYRQSSDN